MNTDYIRLIACAALFLLAGAAGAGDAVEAGDLVVQGTTVRSIALRWDIAGDDNRNAEVTVSYRRQGEINWQPGLAMLRIGGEDTGTETYMNDYEMPSQFAGSILGLSRGVTYEIRVVLEDEDGGNRNMVMEATTRDVPVATANSRVLHLYPKDEFGVKNEPNFDTLGSAISAAFPGDTVLVYGGTYQGSYVVQNRGEPGKPIKIQGVGDKEAVFVGDRWNALIDIHNAAYLWFEGLTFRDPGTHDGHHTGNGVVIQAGNRKRNIESTCVGLTVRYCKFEDFGTAIMASDANCRDFTITDNSFYGRQNWLAPLENKEFNYLRYSGSAVTISGSSHDIGYNYIENVRTGIRVTNGRDGRGFRKGQENMAIDIYGNEITQVGRDFVDVSEGDQNIIIRDNFCVNSGRSGFTIGPVYGGPIYVISNVLYNVMRSLPMHLTRNATGIEAYHNTFVTGGWANGEPFSNSHFRNNIFVGRPNLATHTSYTSFDYNAWKEGPVTYGEPSNEGATEFASLAEFAANTGMETNGRMIEYSDFEKLKRPLLKLRTYDPSEINFHLQVESTVEDAAVVITGLPRQLPIGNGPDMGAWELGQDRPHYGPRPPE